MHVSKKINVAYVALAPFISGSERCLQLMIKNAETYGIRPILITPRTSPMKEWCFEHGIKHYEVDISLISFKTILIYFFNQLKLAWILKKEKIQIVHGNQIWNFKVLDRVSSLLNVKRVCHFRDPINTGSNWWLPRIPDLSIFISRHIETEFKAVFDFFDQNRMITMLDLVSFDNSSADPPPVGQISSAKNQFGLNDNVFVFGYIGQIAPVKGVVELLQILIDVNDKDWILLIAGKDQSEKETYLQECKRVCIDFNIEDKVIFCGFLESTKEFYLACDIIAMFSIVEPLGLVPLEAALHHTPTVANAVGGLTETILHERTGYLVDINDKVKVARMLDSIMGTDLTVMGAEARRFVESKCAPYRYMTKLYSSYQDILNQ